MDEGCLKALPGEPLADPRDRRAADLQGVCDLHIRPGFVGSIPALIGLEQDARMGQLARRSVAAGDQASSRRRSSAVKFTGFFLLLGMRTPPDVCLCREDT